MSRHKIYHDLSNYDRNCLRAAMRALFGQYLMDQYLRGKSAELEASCTRIEAAVDALPEIEKRIIRARHMQDDYVTDLQIYTNELGVLDHPITQKTFERIIVNAFYKLALKMDIPWRKEETSAGSKSSTHSHQAG